jgi:peptide/nickel transport system ATP-binding protein
MIRAESSSFRSRRQPGIVEGRNDGLAVRGLTIGYQRRDAPTAIVVQNVDLDLTPGRILGLAGESGCGKSTTALAAIGFPIPGSLRVHGEAHFGGRNILTLPYRQVRRLWGSRLAYLPQNAGGALSPLRTVRRLVAEPLALHLGLRGRELQARTTELLEKVGIPDPEDAIKRYPHQFSGGQQQRLALAIATACSPAVLVLDEPTTGLDVTTQAQILALVSQLVRDTKAAALYVSHDLAALATICDDLAIMYAGEIVERAPAEEIYSAPRHPYTAGLLDSAPRIDATSLPVPIEGLPPPHVIVDSCPFAARCAFVDHRCRAQHPAMLVVGDRHGSRCLRSLEIGVVPRLRATDTSPTRRVTQTPPPQLMVERLSFSYRRARQPALHDLSLELFPGEVLGLVGESGSGKSTLLRLVAGLLSPDYGRISLEGASLSPRAVKRSRAIRKSIQIVFQDPDSSLNPRHSIANTLERPLRLFRPDLDRRSRRSQLLKLVDQVRLDEGVLRRYPHELSGGQKQRVALARAFAAQPRIILCDEVVSALDVSVQASILRLLAELSSERGVSLLFVTHDLSVVRALADRIAVMRNGEICEVATTSMLFAHATHAYTRQLLEAVPRLKESRERSNERESTTT